jgi:hypothetical protein
MYDTAHYIRIQKAFLDQEKNALTMAREADSNYYKDLTVTLIESNNTGAILNTLALQRVNLIDEGYNKDANGDFFTSPNYAYKVIKPNVTYVPSAYYQYRAIIKNNQTGRVDSSRLFTFVNADSSNNPASFYIPQFISTSYSLAFAKTSLPSYVYELGGRCPMNAKMVEGHILFRYVDSNIVTGAQTDRVIDYLFANDVQDGNGQFQLKVQNASIYSFLRDEMGNAPENIVRLMDSCDVKIFAGSEELYTYQQVTLAQAGGLTGDQIKPHYTNMTGKDVMGIIASRATRTYSRTPIDQITLDSMIKHPLLTPVKIKGRSSH